VKTSRRKQKSIKRTIDFAIKQAEKSVCLG
jgi:hypothetical protein